MCWMVYTNLPMSTCSCPTENFHSENGGFNEFLIRKFSSHNWLPTDITDTDVTQLINLLHKHECGILESSFQSDKTGRLDANINDDETNGWILVKNTKIEPENSNNSDRSADSEDINGESIENKFTIIQFDGKVPEDNGGIEDGKTCAIASSVTNQDILSAEVAVKLCSKNESQVQCGEPLSLAEDGAENEETQQNSDVTSELQIQVEKEKISSIYKLHDADLKDTSIILDAIPTVETKDSNVPYKQEEQINLDEPLTSTAVISNKECSISTKGSKPRQYKKSGGNGRHSDSEMDETTSTKPKVQTDCVQRCSEKYDVASKQDSVSLEDGPEALDSNDALSTIDHISNKEAEIMETDTVESIKIEEVRIDTSSKISNSISHDFNINYEKVAHHSHKFELDIKEEKEDYFVSMEKEKELKFTETASTNDAGNEKEGTKTLMRGNIRDIENTGSRMDAPSEHDSDCTESDTLKNVKDSEINTSAVPVDENDIASLDKSALSKGAIANMNTKSNVSSQDQTRKLKVGVNIDTTVIGHNLQKTVMSTEIVATIKTVQTNAKNKMIDSVECESEAKQEMENNAIPAIFSFPTEKGNRAKNEIDFNVAVDNPQSHENSTTKSFEINLDQSINKNVPHKEVDVNYVKLVKGKKNVAGTSDTIDDDNTMNCQNLSTVHTKVNGGETKKNDTRKTAEFNKNAVIAKEKVLPSMRDSPPALPTQNFDRDKSEKNNDENNHIIDTSNVTTSFESKELLAYSQQVQHIDEMKTDLKEREFPSVLMEDYTIEGMQPNIMNKSSSMQDVDQAQDEKDNMAIDGSIDNCISEINPKTRAAATDCGKYKSDIDRKSVCEKEQSDCVNEESENKKEIQTNGTSTSSLSPKAAVHPNVSLYGQVQSFLSDVVEKHHNGFEGHFTEEDVTEENVEKEKYKVNGNITSTSNFIMGFESTYHWEDPIYTGVVFGTVMATLISICYYSLISVCAYTSLFILMCVAGLKLYTYVMVTFLKKETANPIAKYTGMDVTIAPERVNEMANKATTKLNSAILELRRLFLVETMMDSIKFGLSLWVLTYIGSWFNAMTLIIMSWVGLFTIPKIYLNNKAQIDPVLDQVKAKFDEVSGKVFAMIPQGKGAAEKKEE